MDNVKRIRHTSLRAWRKAHGLSQSEAGKRFGLSQPGYGKIELGARHPRPALAAKLMLETGVDLAVIMGIAS